VKISGNFGCIVEFIILREGDKNKNQDHNPGLQKSRPKGDGQKIFRENLLQWSIQTGGKPNKNARRMNV